jgi:hypothetical protein
VTRPSPLWLTAAAVLVGYTAGWIWGVAFPRCLDSIVRGVTTRARWWL